MLPHQIESERLARTVTVAQELAILAQAPHKIRILDGSHLTPVIHTNAALTIQSEDVREVAKRQWDQHATVDYLRQTCEDSAIVAMPKHDSSREIAQQLEMATGLDVPCDDKYLLSLVLEEGEFVAPQPVPFKPWAQLHFSPRAGDEILARSFQAAIHPLVRREIWFTCFRPTAVSPAYRLEIKEGATAALCAIFTTLANQITGPFVQEPYPQYVACPAVRRLGG